MLGGEVYIAIITGELHHEPSLALTAPFGMSGGIDQFRRKVVAQPTLAFRNDHRLIGTDFLFEFTKGGGARFLAFVDAALWHLPRVAWNIQTTCDEHLSPSIEHHHAYACSIFGIVMRH